MIKQLSHSLWGDLEDAAFVITNKEESAIRIILKNGTTIDLSDPETVHGLINYLCRSGAEVRAVRGPLMKEVDAIDHK